MMLSAVLCALLSAASRLEGPVLLVNYQGSGLERSQVEAVSSAWRAALEQGGARVVSDEKLQRASALCGEEASCLAGLGARASAAWVLALGVGQVGNRLVSSAVFVESRTARVLIRRTTTHDPSAHSWDQNARQGVEAFLAALPPLPPPPPREMSPLRPYAWAAAGTSGALLLGSVVVGGLAWSNYDQLKALPTGERGSLSRRQLTINRTADGLLIAGALVGGAAAALFLWPQPRAPVAVNLAGPGLVVQGNW